MRHSVDLNSDLGEGAPYDEQILDLVTSANIACGLHAGDPVSILSSIRIAKSKGVAVGAHPSFDDRAGFGRTEIETAPEDVFALVAYQLGAFRALCAAAGVEMNHVKPHGALYNMAARNMGLAEAIMHAVLATDARLLILVPPRSCLQRAASKFNIESISEFFADRNYTSDGSLVSRSNPGALLRDPIASADRVIRMLREGVIRSIDGTDVAIAGRTICVHGDTPAALDFASALRHRLELENIAIAAPQKPA